MLYEMRGIMKIETLMEKHGLTGDPAAFLAAVAEYATDRHRPTVSETTLIGQIAGDLDLDQGVALGALRGGGTKALHELAKKVRHQAGRPAVTDTKPGEAQAAAARREVARRKANRRAHVVTVGG